MNEHLKPVAFPINIVISDKDGKPIIELRKVINEEDKIKIILSAAFREQPVIFQPRFNDKFRAIACLLDKGVIYKDDKDGQFYFTF